MTDVALRSPRATRKARKLRRLGDGVQIATLSTSGGEFLAVAAKPQLRPALAGRYPAGDAPNPITVPLRASATHKVVARNEADRGGELKLKTGLDGTERVRVIFAVALRLCKWEPSWARGGRSGFTSTRRPHSLLVRRPTAVKPAPGAAHGLEVDMCGVDSGRFWMMTTGCRSPEDEVVNFHGVDMRSAAGDMTGAEILLRNAEHVHAVAGSYRRRGWPVDAGRPVYLCGSLAARYRCYREVARTSTQVCRRQPPASSVGNSGSYRIGGHSDPGFR